MPLDPTSGLHVSTARTCLLPMSRSAAFFLSNPSRNHSPRTPSHRAIKSPTPFVPIYQYIFHSFQTNGKVSNREIRPIEFDIPSNLERQEFIDYVSDTYPVGFGI
eukprot:sb/3477989/